MNSVKEIWSSQSDSAGHYVKTKIEFIKNLNCFAATMISTGNRMFILELKNNEALSFPGLLRFRGMTIQTLNYDDHKELTILLTDNALEEIFTSFIENITEEIAGCLTSEEALPKITGVIIRWKRLFDRAGFCGLDTEQQKGLFGELHLICSLLREKKPAYSVIDSWTGPAFKDQDFDFGHTRVEIKLTSSKYASAKITNERQLTVPPGTKLFLVIFVVEEVKKGGLSLPKLITDIESEISGNIQAAELFKTKLNASGYNIDDAEFYEQEYYMRDKRIYEVNDQFPKITSDALSGGIYNVSYRIELSACEPFRIFNSTTGTLIYGY